MGGKQEARGTKDFIKCSLAYCSDSVISKKIAKKVRRKMSRQLGRKQLRQCVE